MKEIGNEFSNLIYLAILARNVSCCFRCDNDQVYIDTHTHVVFEFECRPHLVSLIVGRRPCSTRTKNKK